MYQIIYADPPWTYRDSASAGGRGAEHKYPLLTNYDIKRLRVDKISADNSVCFLWVTSPLLKDGIETLEAWGFRYVTKAFTWIKVAKNGNPKIGMGHWTRANSEDVLLGVRGKPKRINAGVSQVILGPAARHSEKPAEVRDKIVQLMGDVPRIELFSRHIVTGWDSLGLDVGTGDIRDKL